MGYSWLDVLVGTIISEVSRTKYRLGWHEMLEELDLTWARGYPLVSIQSV